MFCDCERMWIQSMKGFAMLGIGKTGWIEKDAPVCGPLDAIW